MFIFICLQEDKLAFAALEVWHLGKNVNKSITKLDLQRPRKRLFCLSKFVFSYSTEEFQLQVTEI